MLMKAAQSTLKTLQKASVMPTFAQTLKASSSVKQLTAIKNGKKSPLLTTAKSITEQLSKQKVVIVKKL